MLAYDNAPARHRRGRQLASNLVNNSKKQNKTNLYSKYGPAEFNTLIKL